MEEQKCGNCLVVKKLSLPSKNLWWQLLIYLALDISLLYLGRGVWPVLQSGELSRPLLFLHFPIGQAILTVIGAILFFTWTQSFRDYLRQNVIGSYIYLNLLRQDSGKVEVHFHLLPMEPAQYIIRIKIGGWWRRDRIIRDTLGCHKLTYRKKSWWQVRVWFHTTGQDRVTTLFLTDHDGATITTSDADMICLILNARDYLDVDKTLKHRLHQERSLSGAWLYLHQALGGCNAHSPYLEFPWRMSEAVLKSIDGNPRYWPDLASRVYLDEVGSWANEMNPFVYLLDPAARRQREEAKIGGPDGTTATMIDHATRARRTGQ